MCGHWYEKWSVSWDGVMGLNVDLKLSVLFSSN